MEREFRRIVEGVAKRMDAFDITTYNGEAFPEPHMIGAEIQFRNTEDIDTSQFGILYLIEPRRPYRGIRVILALRAPTPANQLLEHKLTLFRARVNRRFKLAIVRYERVMVTICHLPLPTVCIRELRDYLF
jgi:hypothetical protein